MYYLKASKRNHHFTQWKMLGRVLHFVHSAQHSVGLFSYIILYCIKLYWNFKLKFQFSSVQSLSRVQLFATPWTVTRQASLSITNCQSLPKPMSHWVGDAIQPSHPLSSPSPPALNLSQHQGLFQWEKFQYISLRR